jgi:uncharacterized membrane protein YbaN (DUF454 family)
VATEESDSETPDGASHDSATPDHDRLGMLRDGLTWDEAIEATVLADGLPTESTEQARAHLVVRMARLSLAVALLMVGVVLLVLPGPGWLVIAAGLAVLARDVAWAERWLTAVRRRVPGARADGSLPPGVIATIVVMALAATAISLWVAVGR